MTAKCFQFKRNSKSCKSMPPKKNLKLSLPFRRQKPKKNPEKNIGSNHILRNRQFFFAPKIQYELVAERSDANPSNLQFPTWCSILKIVRTHFAACGGEEVPPRKFGKAAEPHRSKPQKNPEKNIGSNHIFILGEENFLITSRKL